MTTRLKSACKPGLLLPACSCVLLLCLMGCSDDYGTQLPDSGDGRISFSVSNAAGADAETRSASPVYDPLVLLGGNGGDTLYLHTLVIDSIPSRTPDDAGPQTRGVPVTQTTLDAFGVTAMLDVYLAPYMNNVPITVSNRIGSPANPYFWPEGTLRFYAYSPQDQLYTADQHPTFTDGTIRFQYTTPKSSDGTTDAEQQPDVLFAYAAASLAEQPDGQVPLTFHHALSAIKFVAGDIAGGTIKQISIKNVYREGSATYDASQEENRFEWTFNEEAKPDQSYTQTFNVKVNDALTGTQEITDKNPETTFMMIPQPLADDALIQVVIDTDENGEKTLTGKIKSNGLAAWEAGKQYTYTISTSSINWTYVLEVTENVTIPFGSTTGDYEVKSYRYRTNNPSNIEAVGWSAAKPSDVDFITEYTNKGNGVSSSEDKETYNITVTRPETTTTWDGDERLRNNPSEGSEAKPFDLSTNGGNEAQTTANCYVVSAPGTYSLPLVYGNAIKGGVDNILSQPNQTNSTAFKNYKGTDITSPEISGVHDCCLVWCDAFYVIRDVKLSDGKLVFTVASENLQQCNAIVAARDGSGTIMWSWHIWITEHNINDVVEVQDWGTNGSSNIYYNMMKWPLGWVDGKTVTYEERNTEITFTQEESGNTATLALNQEGKELDYRDGGSTYYQWGRKDPIVALKNRDESGSDDYRPLETGQDSYGYVIPNVRASLADGIQHPNKLYGDYDVSKKTTWLTTSYKNLWDNSGSSTSISQTESIKTVYDPSPRGFKVPPAHAFSRFVKGCNESDAYPEQLNGTVAEKGFKYKVYYDKNNNTIELTATGQRSDRNDLGKGIGSLWAMDGVYYQTCNALNNKDESYCLVLRDMSIEGGKEWYTYGFSGSQTMARPVRSIKE